MRLGQELLITGPTVAVGWEEPMSAKTKLNRCLCWDRESISLKREGYGDVGVTIARNVNALHGRDLEKKFREMLL